MKLRIIARPGHVAYYPGLKWAGQLPPYIGRRTVIAPDGSITHPTLDEPTEIDATSDAGRRVIDMVARNREDPPFWAADETTARALGVQLAKLQRDEDGEFHAVTPDNTKKAKTAA